MEPLNSLGTALVTGGASGMGLAIVERLARDGFRVVMADRNAALADQETQALRAQGLDVDYRVVDLADEHATRALVRELAPLAALVNNAGLFDERKFFDVSSDDYRRMFDVNLLAVATLTQEAARDMAAGGGSSTSPRAPTWAPATIRTTWPRRPRWWATPAPRPWNWRRAASWSTPSPPG